MDCILFVTVTVCFLAVVQPSFGQECSNITFPDSLELSEKFPTEMAFLEINTTDTVTDPWRLSPSDYFKFSYSSKIYKLSLKMKIDLGCQKEKIFKLDFVCGSEKQSMDISVQYVDQYPPQWITTKVRNNLRVTESDLPGRVVLDLDEAIEDPDCYKGGNHIEVVPYTTIPQFDASRDFAYNDTTKQVYLSRGFDYDKRYCDLTFKRFGGIYFFQLMLYSEDNNRYNSPLTINVTFTGVDDEPPVFLKSRDCIQCMSVCKSLSQSYVLQLENDIQKNLTYDVFAKDFDTIDEDLEYIIVGVNPEFIQSYIHIDPDNGTVSVQVSTGILSSGNESNTVDSINIFLQVRESHTNHTSDNMTLTFIILSPKTPTTENVTSAVTEITTTFHLSTETTRSTTEDPGMTDMSSNKTVSQIPPKTTTETVHYLSDTDTGYYRNIATVLMIILIAIGSIVLLVTSLYIIYKCRKHPDNKRQFSVAKQSTPFVTKL